MYSPLNSTLFPYTTLFRSRIDQPLRLFRGALILPAAPAPESNLAVRPDNAPIRRNLLHPRLAGADMGEWHRLAQRFLGGSGGAFHGLLKKLQIQRRRGARHRFQ